MHIKQIPLFALIFMLMQPTAFAASKPQKVPVKLGIITPLTGSMTARGEDLSRFIEILKPHLDQRVPEFSYEFILDDGKCGAGNAATTIAKKMIFVDDIKFLITTCSGETLQVGPIAQANKVINFATMSTHQDVKFLGDYVFRTFIDIDRGIAGFAKHMVKKSNGKIVLLTEENAFTFGIKDLLKKYLGKHLVLSDDFSADTYDFNSLLLRIKTSEAQGIYFNVSSDNTLIALVNKARALGLTQQIYSYSMPEAKSFRDAVGKNGEGLEYLGTPLIGKCSKEYETLMDEFYKNYPQGPSYEYALRTFYDAVLSIVAGVEAVGASPTKVKDFLLSYQTLGALGTIKYDQNGDLENMDYVFKRITAGEEEYVGKLDSQR
jgi:ABC-type branched-subunit amino acid transport system substrate-binding protein